MPPEDAASGPVDPFSALAEGAAQLHELFMAYVHAGFARTEALQIVIGRIDIRVRSGQEQSRQQWKEKDFGLKSSEGHGDSSTGF